MDTPTLRRQRAGGFMLDMLAAAALMMAINQAMSIADGNAPVDSRPPGVSQAVLTPAGLIVQNAPARVACSPIEESGSPLLRGYGRYLLAEHALATGDFLSLPTGCALKQSALIVQPSAVQIQVNDEQELVQPEGLRLI